MRLKARFKRLGVVVFENDRVFGEARGNTGGRRISEREHAGTGFHEQAVGVAVVAPFELHDLVALRVAARETDGTHAGFGAGTHEPHLFTVGHDLEDFFRKERLAFRHGAEREAVRDRFFHGFDDGRMVVPQNHRAPGADVVNEAAAFGVPHIGALGAADKARCAAHAAESAYGGIHAAGNGFGGTFKEFFIDTHFG